jgi:predicted metal-dependent hydrolase
MKKIKYRESIRARDVSITVDVDGSVLVVKPIKMHRSIAEEFVRKKRKWILKSIKHFQKFNDFTPIKGRTRRDYLKHKENARCLIHERIEYFSNNYKFPVKRIAIKNHRRCWGSCSEKGNLNFNYRILFLPEHIRDYIIVHELCHLFELNHSPRFWVLVEEIMPNYKMARKELKKHEIF